LKFEWNIIVRHPFPFSWHEPIPDEWVFVVNILESIDFEQRISRYELMRRYKSHQKNKHRINSSYGKRSWPVLPYVRRRNSETISSRFSICNVMFYSFRLVTTFVFISTKYDGISDWTTICAYFCRIKVFVWSQLEKNSSIPVIVTKILLMILSHFLISDYVIPFSERKDCTAVKKCIKFVCLSVQARKQHRLDQ